MSGSPICAAGGDEAAARPLHVPEGRSSRRSCATSTTRPARKILAGENGEDDHTLAQVRADDSDEPSVFVPAKKIGVSSPSVSASASASSSSSSSAGPGLPVTGDDTMLFVGAAAIAVAVGTVLVLVARRRRVRLQA